MLSLARMIATACAQPPDEGNDRLNTLRFPQITTEKLYTKVVAPLRGAKKIVTSLTTIPPPTS